jgi:NADH dehydrogenase FAD-containing subunit
VVAVGATTNTFGVRGVGQHCQFLKQIEDAASVRKGDEDFFYYLLLGLALT